MGSKPRKSFLVTPRLTSPRFTPNGTFSGLGKLRGRVGEGEENSGLLTEETRRIVADFARLSPSNSGHVGGASADLDED